MKHSTPSVLAIAALLFAPAMLRADCGKEGCGEAKACAVSTAAQASGCTADCQKACCAEAAAKITKVQYEVKDLACADCENKVKQVLASLDGVGEAAACSKEKQVKVAYDAKKIKEKQLMAAIRSAGFKVSAETVEFKVDGMKCQACSGKVSQALAGLKGVQKQDVCHESGKALVKFDPETVSRDKVLAAIEQTGFKTIQ